jgi:hypothetical protein
MEHSCHTHPERIAWSEMNDSADRVTRSDISMPPPSRSKSHLAREKFSYRLLISRKTSNGEILSNLIDQKYLRVDYRDYYLHN